MAMTPSAARRRRPAFMDLRAGEPTMAPASGRGGNPPQPPAPYVSPEAWMDQNPGAILRDTDFFTHDFRDWVQRTGDQMAHRGARPDIDPGMVLAPPDTAAPMPDVLYPQQPLANGDPEEAWWSDIPGELYLREEPPAPPPPRRTGRTR